MRTFFLRGLVAAFAARLDFELTWDNPFPFPMGLSDTASEDTPLEDTPFRDMPVAEGTPATTEMTSQKRTASTMNLSRLLRTALFSVLGLFLAGGLMTVQAQDIVIDEDDGETIDGQLDAAQDGDVVEIVAGRYNEDVVIDADNTSLSSGESLTIRASEDVGDQDVRITQLKVSDNIQLEIESDGNGGFFNLTTDGSRPDFDLDDTTIDLESTGVLELADGIEIRQTANGELAQIGTSGGNAPTFNGSVGARFDVGSGAIDASSEPNIVPSNQDVEVGVEGTGPANDNDDVSLPSDATIADVLDSDPAPFGDGDALTVNNSSAEAVLNGGTVTGVVDNTHGGTITADASVTFEGEVDQSSGSGTFTANAGLTFEGGINNSASGTVDFQSGTSTYDPVGNTFNNSGGSINIASGATLDINSVDGSDNSITALTNDGGVTGAGTLEFSGDGNDDFTVDVSDESAGNEILADQSPGGTPAGEIKTDRPLTLDEGGTGANAINVGNVTADGTVDFGVSGNDTGPVTTGNLTANAAIDFTAGDATGTVTTGDITASANVTLSGIGSDITTGDVTANSGATVDFNGSGSGSSSPDLDIGAVTADGKVDLSGVSDDAKVSGDVDLNGGGTFDIIGSTIDLNNSTLTQASNSTFDTNNNTDLTLSGDEDDRLDHNTLTTVGVLSFSKTSGATMTMQEAIQVDDTDLSGVVTVSGPTTFQDNLILTGGNGSGGLAVNGDLTQSTDQQGNETFIIYSDVVASGSKSLSGSQTQDVRNVRVDNGGTDVDIGSSVIFTRRLELLSGGISLGSNNFSPASGATIERDVAGTDTDIDASGGGTFNNAGNGFDLTVAASSAATKTAGAEFDGLVDNVTIETDATYSITEDETVNASLAVNSGAALGDNAGNHTVELAGDDQTHSIVGRVGENSGTITLDVTGAGSQGVTIEGSTDDADEARIEGLTASATGVSVSSSTPLQQIDGDVTVEDQGSLDLALEDAAGDGLSNGVTGDNDQAIEGQLTVNDQLTLSSNVEVTSNANSDAVQVDASGENGEIRFGDFNLTITGDGANFDGDQDATYSSTGGELILSRGNGASGNNAQGLGTAGVSVPRVSVEDRAGSKGVTLNDDAATSTLLDVDTPIALSGNTFEVSGVDGDAVTDDVALNANVTGSGDFRAVGTRITAEAGVSISNFTVDPGSGSTVELRSDDNTVARTVTVGSAFDLASGAFDHGQNELEVDGTFTYSGAGNENPEIAATSGFVDLNNSGLTLSLSNPIQIDNLRVTSDADLGTDDVSLTIENELELDDNFDATTSTASVVMDNGATVQRLRGTRTGGVDPLEEALTVNGSDKYNVTYGDNSGANNYDSHFELLSNAVSRLTVNTQGTVFLDDNSNVLAGDVTVGELVLENGDLDYGRQLIIDDQGTVTRRSGALADAAGVTADPDTDSPNPLNANGTYTLKYDGASGDIDASSREFIADSEVSSPITLETTMGDASGSADHAVTIDLDRTVSSLTVNNVTDGSNTDIDGVTLEVDGDADVKGGDLTQSNSGSVELTGSSSTFTATGSGVDVGAGLTLANALDVESGATVDATVDVDGTTTLSGGGTLTGTITSAGDITVEGGNGTLGGSSTDFTFDGGKEDQAISLNGTDAEAENLTMAKDNESPVPQTTVSGGDLLLDDDPDDTGGVNTVLDLNNGVLAFDSESGTVDLGNETYEREENDPNFDPADDTSHVAGNIVRTLGGTDVGGGDAVGDRVDVTYPVGSANAAYRPLQLIFDPNNSLDENNVTIGHEQAENRESNLPIETASGTIIGTETPGYYWRTETDVNLGIGQDFEIAATATNLALNEPLANHRLIRQEESGSDWTVQGADGQYNNTGSTDRAILRNEESTGGLSPEPRRLAVGVPARAPTFTAAPTSGETKENVELTATFDAETQDPASDPGAVSFSVDAPSAIADSVEISSSGELSYRPDFDDAGGAPYDITVIAEDDNVGTTVETTFEAKVENNPAPPAYTAPVTDETIDEGNTVTKTFEADLQDPGSSGSVQFSVDAPAEIADSIEVDQQTGNFSYTAGFEDASASNDPTEYVVTAKATDSDVQATKDSTFTITVDDDPVPPTLAPQTADRTVKEGEDMTPVNFDAETEDPNSGPDEFTFSVSPSDPAIADSVDIDDTGEVTYTPGFDDAANSPYTLTVTAEDENNGATVTSEITVTVNGVGQEPAFTTAPSGGTVAEGEELTDANGDPFTFEAETQDPSTTSPDAIEFAVNAPSSIADSVDIDENTGELTYTPGFDDAANSPYNIEVEATDTEAQTSATTTFKATVTNNPQGPAFVEVDPDDLNADGNVVARDVAPDNTGPTELEITFQSDDPASTGSDLTFGASEDWAAISGSPTVDGDQATATVELTPGLDEAQAAANGDGTLDVTVTATDDAANGDPAQDQAVSVDVRFNPVIGDPFPGGDRFGTNDALVALAVAVNKSEITQGNTTVAFTPSHLRAADVVPSSVGDTLSANADDVDAFDALTMLQVDTEQEYIDQVFGSGAAAATAVSNASTGQSNGDAIQIGEIDRKDGTAVVPVRLAEGTGNVQAADIEVALNSDVASVKDVQASTPGGWISSYNVSDEGVLTMGMAGTSVLPSGQIATIRLDVSDDEEPFTEGTYQLNGADEQDLTVETKPSEFTLKSNYPNPVKTSTTIEYELKEARSVTLEVYNTLGQKVATLVDREKEAGSYSVNWEAGSEVSSGVYFYRIEAGDFTETKRITVVR